MCKGDFHWNFRKHLISYTAMIKIFNLSLLFVIIFFFFNLKLLWKNIWFDFLILEVHFLSTLTTTSTLLYCAKKNNVGNRPLRNKKLQHNKSRRKKKSYFFRFLQKMAVQQKTAIHFFSLAIKKMAKQENIESYYFHRKEWMNNLNITFIKIN